jgi:hypothetical protein
MERIKALRTAIVPDLHAETLSETDKATRANAGRRDDR